MSDGVLAAIIAAGATVFASFLQLRASVAKELAARGVSSAGRRKNRLSFYMLGIMLGGAAVAGFAFSRWLTERERAAQDEVLRALQDRIETMTHTESALEQTRSEIEASVLRELGMQGVVVAATVAPCKPPLVVSTPALTPSAGENPTRTQVQATTAPPSSTCTESDATPVTLCATIPSNATVTDVELYVRDAGSDTPWANARVTAGADVGQARFAEQPIEVADDASIKQVCQGFTQWSTGHARIARMRVRYRL